MTTVGKSGRNRLVRAMVAAVGAVTLVGVGTMPATATANARDGVCDDGEFCLYYLSNRGGSVSDFTTSISNYGATQPTCYEFKGPGAGQGECVKNNAMSAWNRRDSGVDVFFYSNYGNPSDYVGPNSWRNLNVTSNENASHRFR